MLDNQLPLFNAKKYKRLTPPLYSIQPLDGHATVRQSLPAYHSYLESGDYSKYTPNDFCGDMKKLAEFVSDKPLVEVTREDVQQWIGKLKTEYSAKTVSRKISAANNYFGWLVRTKVLTQNPMETIHYFRATPPLPEILFESECQKLITAASKDPRTYLLVQLLLETGLKKEELFNLKVTDFDSSNRYAPVLWVRHEGKKVWKDRHLKLPADVGLALADYVEKYKITDKVFPYTTRFIEMLLSDIATAAQVRKKVTASILRDTFVVRCLQRGEEIEDVFMKIGLNDAWEDAKKKYMKLSSKAMG